MEHVIAMDPGGRSGWASAIMSENQLVMTGTGVLRQDEMEPWFAVQQRVTGPVVSAKLRGVALKQRPAFNVFVYESWYPRRDHQGRMDWIEGNTLDEAQHIGALKFIATASGARIVTQHPSDKPQAVATMPERLKALDQDSNEQHDQDARMHLWLYFYRNWFDVADADNLVLVT